MLGGYPFSPVITHTLSEPQPELGAHFGRDAIVVSDMDKDGYDDVIVSAPFADADGKLNAGRLHIFSGGRSFNIAVDLTLAAPNAEEDALFGSSAAAGRIDGPWRTGLVVGALGATTPGGNQKGGALYAFMELGGLLKELGRNSRTGLPPGRQ